MQQVWRCACHPEFELSLTRKLDRYVRSPKRIDPTTTYVFPRPLGGGVILGGSRDDGNWSDEWDEKLGKEIMERCCALCPELGKPEDLQVISKNIGLRRKFTFEQYFGNGC
jgi:D-amino-acid oxidase